MWRKNKSRRKLFGCIKLKNIKNLFKPKIMSIISHSQFHTVAHHLKIKFQLSIVVTVPLLRKRDKKDNQIVKNNKKWKMTKTTRQ